MPVELRPEPSYEDVLHIARNLRERDRQEIFATRWDKRPEALALDVANSGAFRWAAYLDGRPVAAIGATPRWRNVWNVWAFGTDEWPRVVVSLTRHALRFMAPGLVHAGAIRADCFALATHTDARAWLERLGLRPEKVLDNWGDNGESFLLYSWTRQTNKGNANV